MWQQYFILGEEMIFFSISWEFVGQNQQQTVAPAAVKGYVEDPEMTVSLIMIPITSWFA